MNDAVSFLWRWELAGHPRDAEAWRIIHDFATNAFPRAGAAFSDMHIALAQTVAGDEFERGDRGGEVLPFERGEGARYRRNAGAGR